VGEERAGSVLHVGVFDFAFVFIVVVKGEFVTLLAFLSILFGFVEMVDFLCPSLAVTLGITVRARGLYLPICLQAHQAENCAQQNQGCLLHVNSFVGLG
jgi:hypothetical protein